MKRRDLIRKIDRAAKAQGIEWGIARSGAEHDIFRLGRTVQVSVPRHQEINEITARKIMQAGEAELGEEWWK